MTKAKCQLGELDNTHAPPAKDQPDEQSHGLEVYRNMAILQFRRWTRSTMGVAARATTINAF